MCMKLNCSFCSRERRLAKGSGCEPLGGFMSVTALSLKAIAKQQFPGVVAQQHMRYWGWNQG